MLGDTIVDQYAACEAIGMSAEASVVVVRERAQTSSVALLLWLPTSALGAQCDFSGWTDSTADLFARDLQSKASVMD